MIYRKKPGKKNVKRGQLPIIIAFVLVLAIIVSTTYYVSTIPVHIKTNFYGKSYSKWSILSSELNSLLQLMLSYASQKAHSYLYDYIVDHYSESIQYTPYKIRVYNDPLEFDYYLPFYWLDFYGYINFTTGYNIVYDLQATKNTFWSLLSTASDEATRVFNATAYNILKNWIKWIEKAGYTVQIIRFNSKYGSYLTASGITMKGVGEASISFTIKITDISGDYMVYNKSITAYFTISFKRGYTEGEGWILPVIIQSYIIINQERYYYMVPPSQLSLYMSSFIFRTLPSFYKIYGASKWITIKPLAVFYRGQGIENVTYIIKYVSYMDYIDDIVRYLAMTRIYNITVPNNLNGIESAMIGIDINESYPYTSGYPGDYTLLYLLYDQVFYDASSLDPDYVVSDIFSNYYLYPDNIAYAPSAKYYIAGLANVNIGNAVLTAPLQAIFALNFTLYNTWYIGFGWSTDLTGN